MNELLIMQTQQMPVYTEKTPKPDQTKGKSGRFEEMMLGAVRERSRKKRSPEENGGEQPDFRQLPLAELPVAAVQTVPGAAGGEEAKGTVLPVAEPSVAGLPQPAPAPGLNGTDLTRNAEWIPPAVQETQEQTGKPAEPVQAAPEPSGTGTQGTENTVGTAKGANESRAAIKMTPAADWSAERTELRINAEDSEKTAGITVVETADDEPKTVLLSELSLKSLANETVPVKVGENYDPQNPEFAEKLTDTVLYKAEGGVREFEIQLAPAELGKVKINLVFEEGKARVTLVCENPKAQSILDSHAESIRAIIETNTRSETQVHVRPGGEQEQRQENFDGRGQNPRQQEERKPKHQDVSFFIDQLKLNLMDLTEAV